jgi:hypothetical protein
MTTPNDGAEPSLASAGSIAERMDVERACREAFEHFMRTRVDSFSNELLLARSPTSGRYPTSTIQLAWESYWQGSIDAKIAENWLARDKGR